MIDNSAEGIPNFLVKNTGPADGLTVYAIIDGQLKELAHLGVINAWDLRFDSIGNLKFRYTWVEGICDWTLGEDFPGHYMTIYKYDPQKRELIATANSFIRFTTDHYLDYPFSEPYAITNQEIIQIINGAYQCLHDCFNSVSLANSDDIEGMHIPLPGSKKSFIKMLETFWSPAAANHIILTLNNYWKEVDRDNDGEKWFYVSDTISSSFEKYLNIQRTLTKVENYGNNLKKVYTTETDSMGKTTHKSYLLKFCDRGWVLHQDGIFN